MAFSLGTTSPCSLIIISSPLVEVVSWIGISSRFTKLSCNLALPWICARPSAKVTVMSEAVFKLANGVFKSSIESVLKLANNAGLVVSWVRFTVKSARRSSGWPSRCFQTPLASMTSGVSCACKRMAWSLNPSRGRFKFKSTLAWVSCCKLAKLPERALWMCSTVLLSSASCKTWSLNCHSLTSRLTLPFNAASDQACCCLFFRIMSASKRPVWLIFAKLFKVTWVSVICKSVCQSLINIGSS